MANWTLDLGFSSEDEDEVEVPDFEKNPNPQCNNNANANADGWTCTSGVKKGRKMLNNNNVSEMLQLYTDTTRLNQLTQNATCFPFHSKHYYNYTGGRTSKTKRSSSSQTHMQQLKDEAFCSVWEGKDPISSSDDDELPNDEISSVVFGGCNAETSKSSVKAALQHNHCTISMAQLLDNRQGKIRNLHIKSKKGGRRRKQLGQCAVSLSGRGKDMMSSDEYPCESSADDEDNAQISEHSIPIVELERKTMADKFDEAFGSASVDDTRPFFTVQKQSSTGLFGRLQHMMLQQKDQDAEFLKKLHTEVWPKDEARCIDVKILSRSFDAKLSVCCCSLLEIEESSLENPQQDNFGKIWTVIFNPRVCVDVDLEVGNLIRIYPPWKEMQIVRGGEIIILSTYFSQIHT